MATRDRTQASQGIANLLPKLSDLDPDIRFMQLSDLTNILNSVASEYIKTDTHTAARIIEGVLKALADTNGEVQNQALKCVGPLAARTPGEIIAPFIDKVTDLTTSDIDLSIPNTALRMLIASLPRPQSAGTSAQDVKDAYTALSRVLIPRLVGRVVLSTGKTALPLPTGLLQQQKDKGYSADAVDVMIEVIRCYGPLLQEPELIALAKATMDIIESPHAAGVAKKRALAGIGALSAYFNDLQLHSFVLALVESFHTPSLSTSHRRFLVSTVGTLARSTPQKFGTHLQALAPYVLGVLSDEELGAADHNSDDETEVDPETEELRESALVSLEALVGSCPADMQPFMSEAVDGSLRYLKYDPNVAESDDEEMEGAQDTGSDDGVTEDVGDEDDEFADLDGDDAFSDVDDVSWKVRRCAAKALYTIVASSSAADHALLFSSIAPALISRLNNEREDSVRLEVLSATTALIRKTGPASATESSYASGSDANSSVGNSRKRRRQDSEAAVADPEFKGLVQTRASPPIVPASPPSGHQADLAGIVPKIVQALNKLWKKGSVALKQGATILLRTLALSRNGALADHLQRIEDLIADALKPSTAATGGGASGSSATVASLQIEALLLISTIIETNTTSVLIPFVIALITPVTAIVRDRNYKVASETLGTVEQFVKALTPPRLPTANQDHAIHIDKLYNVVIDRVTDNNTDLEVRHRAIQVFGVLIARTSSTQLLSPSSRTKGLGVLSDRLKNETTRLPSARAIGLVGEAASVQDSIGSAWIQDVVLEMAAQLRKADRALRGSCLEALQYIALNTVTAAQLELATNQQLEDMLLTLVNSHDLHLLTPTLVILAKIIPTNAQALVNEQAVQALCSVTQTRLEGPPLKAYLLVVKVIGESGAGAALMKGLLQIGTSGETIVLGRAVGTLLVYGGSNLGVSWPNFLEEVQTSPDVRATCLALTVLGEVGFRMGPSSPLGIDTFVKSLSAESDKVRLAAAMALGSATSSNIPKFLPVILSRLSGSPSEDYLYLHALKEVLQHSETASADLAPFASELWQKLFAVANTEDNRAVGAECIGRLATIDPETYVPELSKSLQDSDTSIRGTVIAAFRFTLTSTGSSYNTLLARTITPILKSMLTDPDISNRRLAITTLNAAIHNKPELVIPNIGGLLPLVLADSFINPKLIKTVKIGPFQHSEDSGLDLRKTAYGTMYALLDTPMAIRHLSIPAIFDRVLDGIPDDQDIRTLCNLMLARLATIDPDETRRRLSPLAERFKVVLGTKIKENAVKQEIEKVNDANSAVIRVSLDLDKKFSTAATDGSGEMVGWKGYLDYIRKDFAAMVRTVQSES